MTDFIWPSDQDRTYNDELNRVCEYLEEVLDANQGPDEFPTWKDAALSERIRRVDNQREYERLKQEVINQRDRAVCAEIERDELAAHVKGLKEALEDITQAAQQEGLQFSGWQEQVDNAVITLLASPTTNLTRRDKIKQAEALNSFADWLPSDYECTEFQGGVNQARRHAKDHAAGILRQAEALNDRPT